MSRKRVIIGQSEWGIAAEFADNVAALVKEAMENRTTVALELLDGAGRSVTVYLNGQATPYVVLDLDSGPKPTEISG